MDIETLFKKLEERKTIIGNYQGHGIWWEDVKEIYDELTTEVVTEVVKIPLFAEDVIKLGKAANLSLFWAMDGNGKTESFRDWIKNPENQETFSRAWNDGYIVKESKYVVTDGNHLYFKGYQEDVDFVILADEQPGTIDYVKKFDTREEAQKVADILGWKIEEVV